MNYCCLKVQRNRVDPSKDKYVQPVHAEKNRVVPSQDNLQPVQGGVEPAFNNHVQPCTRERNRVVPSQDNYVQPVQGRVASSLNNHVQLCTGEVNRVVPSQDNYVQPVHGGEADPSPDLHTQDVYIGKGNEARLEKIIVDIDVDLETIQKKYLTLFYRHNT